MVGKNTKLKYTVTYRYNGQTNVTSVQEMMFILRGLVPNTMIDISISAVTECGVTGTEQNLTIWTEKIRE